MPGSQLTDALQQRRLAGDVAESEMFVDVVTRAVLTCEPRDVSLLFFLSYLRWGHGLEHLISIHDGAQQDRFIAHKAPRCAKVSDTARTRIRSVITATPPARRSACGTTRA